MRHFKATVQYDGTDFHGFQWQRGQRTVQEALEAAIERIGRREGRVTGAGRTDTGVHAIGQVVSFSVESSVPGERMALALNALLPRDVSISTAVEVGPEFNARFSASGRTYGYFVWNSRTPCALLRRYTALCPVQLDLDAMRRAAVCLTGERDFAAFALELAEEASTFRDVRRLEVKRRGSLVVLRVEANAFLRGMVRAIAGTLLDVGSGKRDPGSMPDVLESRERRRAGPSAPPEGLTLLRVEYGERRSYPRRDGAPRSIGSESLESEEKR